MLSNGIDFYPHIARDRVKSTENPHLGLDQLSHPVGLRMS